MEWTFITTHFRKHGIAFFEMVLKAMALKTEDICYDHLRKLKKTGFQQIDLVKESVVLKGFNAIYLKPIWVEKESKVFPNPAKNYLTLIFDDQLSGNSIINIFNPCGDAVLSKNISHYDSA
ncbi:MAG TPA: hypothetical protein PKM18_12235, partial [bacterium]|nr:hypothetical protein [bacterium]